MDFAPKKLEKNENYLRTIYKFLYKQFLKY